MSEIRNIERKAPQGLMLGLLLFNPYTADLFASSYCKVTQHPDDAATNFYHRSFKSLQIGIQKDLNELSRIVEESTERRLGKYQTKYK